MIRYTVTSHFIPSAPINSSALLQAAAAQAHGNGVASASCSLGLLFLMAQQTSVQLPPMNLTVGKQLPVPAVAVAGHPAQLRQRRPRERRVLPALPVPPHTFPELVSTWSGLIWARTGCSGDCAGRLRTCGGQAPASLAQITLYHGWPPDLTGYGMSLVDGFNAGMTAGDAARGGGEVPGGGLPGQFTGDVPGGAAAEGPWRSRGGVRERVRGLRHRRALPPEQVQQPGDVPAGRAATRNSSSARARPPSPTPTTVRRRPASAPRRAS